MALKCVFVEGTARKIEAGTPWCGKKSHTAPEAIGEKELDFGGRLDRPLPCGEINNGISYGKR
jgi:hypothetical protein